ncbi:hypothetical protein Tco_1441363 [Tanacetum coccineum]
MPVSRFNTYTSGTTINSPKPLALPAPNGRNTSSTSQTILLMRRLTKKELEEKRAKNQCFYCDQKYTPGHTCIGQLYLLEVIEDNDELDSKEEFLIGARENGGKYEQVLEELPHISLHALNASVMLVRLGCDMVLEIQWLSTIGDIKCNFKDLKMGFVHGKYMTLRGATKRMVYCCAMLNMISASDPILCNEPSTVQVPSLLDPLLDNYADVFEIPTSLPLKRSHDHRIPIKEVNPLSSGLIDTLLLTRMP